MNIAETLQAQDEREAAQGSQGDATESAARQKQGQWRIGRNHKLQFCVFRDGPDGKEYRTSASGKASSFKTWAAADRVQRALAKEAESE